MRILGTSDTRRLTSGKLLLLKTGATGEIDFGNIISWKRNNKTERVSHMTSANGIKLQDFEKTKSIAFAYTFVLDEHLDTVKELLQKGTKGTATTQASVTAPTGTASFSSVKQGTTYDLGKLNVNTVVVTVSAVAKVVDVDYALDAATGRIRIIQGGGIADAANVSVTFGCAATTLDAFTSADQVKHEGAFTFYEYDQESTTIVEEHKFTGSCYINDAGDNNMDDFSKCTLEVVCHTKPVLRSRQ